MTPRVVVMVDEPFDDARETSDALELAEPSLCCWTDEEQGPGAVPRLYGVAPPSSITRLTVLLEATQQKWDKAAEIATRKSEARRRKAKRDVRRRRDDIRPADKRWTLLILMQRYYS
uniref:Uncharacterized protein n=1 Tax=Caenorhabditis japonica TaxID=281687 RepID=A0A8R1ED15_CAEJA